MVAPPDASHPSADFPPRDAGPLEPAGGAGPEEPGRSAPDRAALQRVLQQSIALLDVAETLEPVDQQLLLGVARRHRGATLCCEPVVVELVSAVLAGFFTRARADTGSWAATPAALIAQSLCDHPATWARLEALWSQLQRQSAEQDIDHSAGTA